MAVTTKKTFNAVGSGGQSSTTVFTPVSIELNNQDDLDVYVTLSGGTRVLNYRQATGSTTDSNHPQVSDTTGLYFPAQNAGVTLYNYILSTDNDTITFNSALPTGAVVSIERRTRDSSSDYTNFAGGSTIRHIDVNRAFDESNFTAQEARNKAFEIEGKIWDKEATSTSFITSNEIVDGTIVADDLASDSVTTVKIVDANVTTTKIANLNVIRDKIANDAIDSTKLADNSINSEHYVDGSIDVEHLADDSVDRASLVADAVDGTKIADDSINSEHYVDSSIDTQHIAADQITNALIADSQIDSEHYVDGSIDREHLAPDIVNATKIADESINSEHYVDASIAHAHLANDIIDGDNIQDNAVNTEHITANAVTDSEIATGTLDNRYYTETELNAGQLDNRYYTETESEALFLRQDSSETIASGVTWSASDTKVATTSAIDARIVDLIDDVGGFVPIANETSFPNANPDVNNGTGTLVSIKALASNLTSNGSGVATVANGTVGNSTVTINGLANSTTYLASFGMIVETTTTLNTYSFHRYVPKATEVNVVASNITNINACGSNLTDIENFADLYQIANSAPTQRADGGSLTIGDLWFDNSSNQVMMVYDGSSGDGFSPITPSQSTITNINSVSGYVTYQEDLGSITDAVNTGSGNNSINTVGAAISNVNTTATNIAKINTVADDLNEGTSEIDTVATNIANVNTVGAAITAVNAVSSNATNINAVHANASNINTVAGVSANVTTVAGSIADVNRYANEYLIQSGTPSGPSAGDLWYNSTANTLNYYSGSTWIGIAPGIAGLINDANPALANHLDCNDKNLTEVGTVSGNNLQLDFGTL